MSESTDIAKLDRRISREDFDRAVILTAQHFRATARQRALHGLSKGAKTQHDQIIEFADAALKTSIAFTEILANELYGVRPPPPDPLAVKQGRFANTLAVDQRSRIHFKKDAGADAGTGIHAGWWWWSVDNQSRVGPYDTEDLAAEAMVHHSDTVKRITEDK